MDGPAEDHQLLAQRDQLAAKFETLAAPVVRRAAQIVDRVRAIERAGERPRADARAEMEGAVSRVQGGSPSPLTGDRLLGWASGATSTSRASV
jgi:hypothetical protein